MDPPLTDFGCFSLGISTNLDSSSFAALSVEALYPNSSETGKCQPTLFLDLSIPPCPDFGFITSSVGIDSGLTDPTLTFNVNRRGGGAPCAFDIEFNLQLPSLGGGCEARVATTGNVALTGLQTIDGVSAIADDIVLVKDQSTGSQNGAYKVKAGAWERTCSMKAGLLVSVRDGTANGGTIWMLTTNNPITVGVTTLTFELAGGAQCCCQARVATIEDIVLTGLQTIDGVLVAEGETVLLSGQATASENGPYLASAGAWTRTCDIIGGMLISVREGDCFAQTVWILKTNDPIDVDTDDLEFDLIRAPGNTSVLLTTNVDTTLSGLSSIDGAATSEGTRVLLTGQTDASENGIYAASAGAWTRPGQDALIVEGMMVTVREGDTFDGTIWMLTTSKPIVVDTTDLTFVRAPVISLFVTVRLATTGQSTRSGLSAIDGVTPVAGDLILVKEQNVVNQHGVYEAAAGSWVKLFSFDSGTLGTIIAVTEGTLHGATFFLVDGNNSVIGMSAYVKD